MPDCDTIRAILFLHIPDWSYIRTPALVIRCRWAEHSVQANSFPALSESYLSPSCSCNLKPLFLTQGKQTLKKDWNFYQQTPNPKKMDKLECYRFLLMIGTNLLNYIFSVKNCSKVSVMFLVVSHKKAKTCSNVACTELLWHEGRMLQKMESWIPTSKNAQQVTMRIHIYATP